MMQRGQLTCQHCGAWLTVLRYEHRSRTIEDVAFACGNCGALNRFARIEIVPGKQWTVVRAGETEADEDAE
jgi:hypothetical protein